LEPECHHPEVEVLGTEAAVLMRLQAGVSELLSHDVLSD
jgi:hypothetical protein